MQFKKPIQLQQKNLSKWRGFFIPKILSPDDSRKLSGLSLSSFHQVNKLLRQTYQSQTKYNEHQP